jgi:hypothetical protein
MRPNTFAEVDGPDDLARFQIDHSQQLPIRPGMAYTRIAIDGNKSAQRERAPGNWYGKRTERAWPAAGQEQFLTPARAQALESALRELAA